MAHPKRNLFTVLGWVVWKALALIGLPIAKKKLDDRRTSRRGLRGGNR